jgi:hypothetical protein
LTPESSIILRDAKAVIIASRAIGPNGCVNSFCPKDRNIIIKSAAKSKVKPTPKIRDTRVTILNESGTKLIVKKTKANTIIPTSKIN